MLITILNYLNSLATAPYCERLNSSIGFEPLNVVANIAILAAAYFSLKLLKQNKVYKGDLKLLPLLISFVGIASTVYHAFPNILTGTADGVSVMAVMAYSLYLGLKRVTNNKISLILPVLFFLLLSSAQLLPAYGRFAVNSLGLVAALSFYFWIRKRVGNVASRLIPVIILFGLAVFIHELDLVLCPYLPSGLHFVWHLIVGYAAYLLVWFLVGLELRKKK